MNLQDLLMNAANLGGVCLLDQSEKSSAAPVEPLGFVAWEVLGSHPYQTGLATLLSPGSTGRSLFVAGWREVRQVESIQWPRPRPTVPLLVYAAPGALRVLYYCTPSEAMLLGQRLCVMAGDWLRADQVKECDPAVLVSLLTCYNAEAPALEALREEPRGDYLTTWVVPWSAEAVMVNEQGQPLQSTFFSDMDAAEARLRLGAALSIGSSSSGMGVCKLSAYAMMRPTTLVPVSMMFDFRYVGPADLQRLQQGRPFHDKPLHDALFAKLPARISGTNVESFLPLRADNWRQHLRSSKEEVQKRLRVPVGYQPPFKEIMPELLKHFNTVIQHLRGHEELTRGAEPGEWLDLEGQVELLLRLRRATGVTLTPGILPEAEAIPLPNLPRSAPQTLN